MGKEVLIATIVGIVISVGLLIFAFLMATTPKEQ
jgi:hypothetical protein